MIFSSSKCPLPALVAWCRTLRHSLGAGLSPVRIFLQQAKSGPRALRGVADQIATRLEQGDSLEDALEPHRDRFPPLFLELVAVGEQTGRLEDTFRELEQYYETSLRVQRNFRSQMAYPAIQFVAAILIISGLIFILGVLAGMRGGPAQGVFGLSGTGGAVTFLLLGFGFLGGLLFLMKLSADSVSLRSRMEGMCLILPAWGPALLMFALHRFCVALRMTTEAGLRAERVLQYSFRATANSAFQRRADAAIAVVKRGGEIHEALEASGAPFPDDFRDAILVAEESGQMSEVTERLADNYREEAERRLRQAAQFTSYAVYGLVGMMIVIAIFSIASIYLGMLGAATQGM
jgi:type IV pilus assembly protein PilC